MVGWRTHFSKLAEKNDSEGFDMDYIDLVDKDLCDIVDICKSATVVDHTTHIGVYRSIFLQDPAAIDNNIQRSRRDMFSLV